MQALCKVEPAVGGIAIREVEQRSPGAGEIGIRVAAAGICGTDMQIWRWAPRMARRMQLPRVLGHEVSGEIESLGSGVTHLKIGDRVTLESHIYCGQCNTCRRGRAHLWVNPPELPHEIAAMLEPFGIAVHASLAGSGVSGQSVLVNGCGPIGLMNVAAARALGARTVIAADPTPLRRTTALSMGADHVLDPGNEDTATRARALTGGLGVDVGIEYSGTEAGFRSVFDSLCKGADFRLVGAPPEAIPVDFTWWLLKCPTMINIHGRRIWDTWTVSTALVLEGKVDLRPIASHVLPLHDAARGFDLILRGEALKPILVPG